MLVPVNLTGNSYSVKARSLTKQVTRNLHPVLISDDPNMNGSYILESFVGNALFAENEGVSRGVVEFNGLLYRILGTSLFEVSSTGIHTYKGTVLGADRCIFSKLGDDLIIVTSGQVYIFRSSLNQIADIDLESPSSATHLNNAVIFDGEDGRFVVSAIGDASDIPALNYATAESDVDDLVRVYAFEEQLYLFGTRTIERWWNSGVGSPPYDRIQGGILQKGLAALYSVADNGEYMFFLGDDFNVYSLRGGQLQKISTLALAYEFDSYTHLSEASGWCMNLRGDWYYVLSFPTDNKTWVYKIGLGWFEWSSGIEGGRNIASSHVFVYNKHIVDAEDGNLYELNFDTYTENADPIIRLRDSAPLHGGALRKEGKRLTMNRLELIMEVGVGILEGQGSDPEIMLQFSDDGGKTFSAETRGKIGQLGSYLWRVEWHCLGSFYSRIIRIKMSDPVFLSIHRAAADIEVGI